MYMQAITTGFGAKNTAKYGVLTYDMRQYLKNPETVFLETGIREKVTDLFVDSEKDLWLVTPKGIWEAKRNVISFSRKMPENCKTLRFQTIEFTCFSASAK